MRDNVRDNVTFCLYGNSNSGKSETNKNFLHSLVKTFSN